MDIKGLLEFSKLLTAFQRIERALYVPGTTRRENDSEHSYHLTLIAWYLISSQKIDLDINRVLMYALVHDLVEVYAGDTFVFSSDAAHLQTKHEREASAAKRIEEEFPEFGSLHDSIRMYEKREDSEARFVYELDKVVPILINYEDGARVWKERGVTLEMIRGEKKQKVELSPEVAPYFDELLRMLESEHDRLFG